jgi:hypothetical protein
MAHNEMGDRQCDYHYGSFVFDVIGVTAEVGRK